MTKDKDPWANLKRLAIFAVIMGCLIAVDFASSTTGIGDVVLETRHDDHGYFLRLRSSPKTWIETSAFIYWLNKAKDTILLGGIILMLIYAFLRKCEQEYLKSIQGDDQHKDR